MGREVLKSVGRRLYGGCSHAVLSCRAAARLCHATIALRTVRGKDITLRASLSIPPTETRSPQPCARCAADVATAIPMTNGNRLTLLLHLGRDVASDMMNACLPQRMRRSDIQCMRATRRSVPRGQHWMLYDTVVLCVFRFH